MNDEVPMVLSERVVLEKFEGDPADGRLLERVVIVDGEVVERETYEIEEQ